MVGVIKVMAVVVETVEVGTDNVPADDNVGGRAVEMVAVISVMVVKADNIPWAFIRELYILLKGLQMNYPICILSRGRD